MRWPIFAIAAYLAVVLQVGLAPHVAVRDIQPEFMLLLAVFIALSAPIRTAVIGCGILGLLLDLIASPYPLVQTDPRSPAAATLIGPYTLGYMAGAYLVVQLRPMLFRQHPLTVAAMVLVAGAEIHLVVLGLLWVRHWYEPMQGFIASHQLIPRALGLLYSAAIGLAFAYPLSWAAPLFGFQTAHPSARTHRG